LSEIEIPRAFRDLFAEGWRDAAYYGGRGGAKSHSVAGALVALAAKSPLRIVCAREIQNSLRDSSKGSIGATTADFVTVPLDRSKGTSNPYEVPTMCGGKDAVSTYGTIGGVASAGAGTTASASASTKPGIALSLNRGLATGEPARLLALAELQQANTAINAIHEYHNCSQTTPPAPATPSTPAAG
jgi:hypothetical protein